MLSKLESARLRAVKEQMLLIWCILSSLKRNSYYKYISFILCFYEELNIMPLLLNLINIQDFFHFFLFFLGFIFLLPLLFLFICLILLLFNFCLAGSGRALPLYSWP